MTLARFYEKEVTMSEINHEVTIAEQKQTIAEQQQTIAEQKQTIAEQQQTIVEQKQTIAEHLETIANHQKMIRLHETVYFEAQTILKGLFELLTNVIELRDPYTEGHSKRVSQIAVALAKHEKAGFPQDKITVLRYGALLHDIGKVAINDLVLNKPTLITKLERRMIEQHVEVGFEMIEPLDFDPMITDIIHYHHESYDGSGYPDGLRGEEIPLAARIVKLADVYDALTSKRPYRPAYSKDEAIAVMKQHQSHFDPTLLEIFIEMVKAKDF